MPLFPIANALKIAVLTSLKLLCGSFFYLFFGQLLFAVVCASFRSRVRSQRRFLMPSLPFSISASLSKPPNLSCISSMTFQGKQQMPFFIKDDRQTPVFNRTHNKIGEAPSKGFPVPPFHILFCDRRPELAARSVVLFTNLRKPALRRGFCGKCHMLRFPKAVRRLINCPVISGVVNSILSPFVW